MLRVRDEPEPPPTPRGSAGLPLVCIHGAGMSSVVWMDFVRRFAPARRVIAPDLPGHGQSDRWHDEISIAGYKEAVGTVCATLKVPRAILIGHSMGAAVALSCALAWPERIAGLVLLNGAARLPVPDEVLELLAQCLPPAGLDDDSVRVDRMPEPIAELSFCPHTAADLRARWQAMLLAATRSVVLGDFAACRKFDVREPLSASKAAPIPVLLISGQEDLLVPPELSAETAALLSSFYGPGVCHEIVENSGHLSHIEQPDTCYTLIEKFLNHALSSARFALPAKEP